MKRKEEGEERGKVAENLSIKRINITREKIITRILAGTVERGEGRGGD